MNWSGNGINLLWSIMLVDLLIHSACYLGIVISLNEEYHDVMAHLHT